ncbi:chitin deacetylase [Coelomomyces lativittatus]|nr:chitin deacetylase [Coelomomyces lativittatus]
MKTSMNLFFLSIFFFSLTRAASIPSFQKWCPECTISPPQTRIKEVFDYETYLLGYNGKCGDGICNIAIGETCATCPKDCRTCLYQSGITGCVNKNHMHLTFENGPGILFSQYLDVLKSLDIKASLFINGVNVLKNVTLEQYENLETNWTDSILASQIKRAYEEGHIIGTNTYSNMGLVNGTQQGLNATTKRLVTFDVLRMQMLMNDIVINDIIGKFPLAFRPPYMELNKTVLSQLETMGYIPISANIDSKDSSAQSTNMLISSMTAEVNKTMGIGMIGLFRDGYNYTLEALPKLVTQLKSRGITFVDLPTCLNKNASAFYRSPPANIFTTGML